MKEETIYGWIALRADGMPKRHMLKNVYAIFETKEEAQAISLSVVPCTISYDLPVVF
jgi:hypothetical protein